MHVISLTLVYYVETKGDLTTHYREHEFISSRLSEFDFVLLHYIYITLRLIMY